MHQPLGVTWGCLQWERLRGGLSPMGTSRRASPGQDRVESWVSLCRTPRSHPETLHHPRVGSPRAEVVLQLSLAATAWHSPPARNWNQPCTSPGLVEGVPDAPHVHLPHTGCRVGVLLCSLRNSNVGLSLK